MIRFLLFSLALILSVAGPVFSQPSSPPSPETGNIVLSNEEKEVLDVVLELFDGYREGDADRVSATLSKEGAMQRVTMKEGQSIVTPTSPLDEFVQYVASGLKEKHDEPLWDTAVHVDGDLASVWTRYAFYLEGKFHHCGVENFLLHKKAGKWTIFHLVDTSQTEGCEIPESVSKKSEF